MKKLLSILSLLLVNNLKAAEPDIIVAIHTLKVTANYENDLKTNKNDELLFIWVGEIEIKCFEKLKNERNTFIQELPGTKMGLLVAKGQALQEMFDLSSLLDSKIEEKYLKTKEKQILADNPYPARQLVPKAPAKALDLVKPGMHKHQCGVCGTVWAHYPGGSHNCPNCGTGEWLHQYLGVKPATFVH